MRETLAGVSRQADETEKARDLLALFDFRADPVDIHPLGDQLADPAARVQAGEEVLEC